MKNNNNNEQILNSQGFGVTNGVTTIIALLAGFKAANISNKAVISALISLLLTDPISDSYSLYISIKDKDEKQAYDIFLKTFLTQIIIQAIFLAIVILSKNINQSFYLSCIFGLLLVSYDFSTRLKHPKIIITELIKMSGLIILTFLINNYFSK
jgi:hypothetical protein